ncbi:MAG: cyclic nucleotide-binding domain-containing protein [Desulfobacteraceae bacterium]|nr:cyclic nucleotide-binding domain-containing protein [Desulfobacteraceae bacterium]
MQETNYLRNNEKVLRILRDVDQFTTFSNEDILSFLDAGKLLEYGKGEEIKIEGQNGFHVYFLLSGEVRIEKPGEEDKILRRTGELFGEMGFMAGEAGGATKVAALRKTLVLRLDSAVIGNKPDAKELALGYTIYRLFCEVLADRLRQATEENARLHKQMTGRA